MDLMFYPPIILYLLGIVLVIGLFESIDDNERGTVKLAVIWPFVALYLIYEIFRDIVLGR
tara:strand:- start:1282 stop:1461 length:180 start_codon:yes stop_codon:yes gene_type:complete